MKAHFKHRSFDFIGNNSALSYQQQLTQNLPFTFKSQLNVSLFPIHWFYK